MTKIYTPGKLTEILRLHTLFRQGSTAGRRADLQDAYLQGADLRDADLQGAYLRGAYLQDADLRGAYLRDADLQDAYLQGAYLQDADLQGAYLQGADLQDAYLQGAYLRGAYLQDAYLQGALGIPVVEEIDKKILALVDTGKGEVDMSTWHREGCDTTHCRAGWAIHLAGEEGYKLEQAVGSGTAGALIYAISCPTLPIPDFYASNEEALADMRERAGSGC